MTYAHLTILLHAPTPAALERARSNARNLLQSAGHPPAQVCIVVNSTAVQTAIDTADALADPITRLCPNSLAKYGLQAPGHLQVLPVGAMLEIARMQSEGWAYVRA